MSGFREAEDIFDAVCRFGVYTSLLHRRAEKSDQLKSVTEKRCGNCGFWMTSYCIPEKKMKQFKSCNSFACKDFELKDLGNLIPKFTKELAVIDEEIAKFKAGSS